MISHLHEFRPMPETPHDTYVCWNCKQSVTYGKPHACDTYCALPELHVISPIYDTGEWRGHCSCGWLSTSRGTEREVMKLSCAVEAELLDSAERMRRFRARQGH